MAKKKLAKDKECPDVFKIIDLSEIEKGHEKNLEEAMSFTDSMSNLDFKDFKKSVIECLNEMFGSINTLSLMMLECFNKEKIDLNMAFGTVGKAIKAGDKVLEVFNERIYALESYALVLGIRTCNLSGNSLDLEGKKDLAKMFGLSWDEVVEDLKHHLKEEADKSTLKVVH